MDGKPDSVERALDVLPDMAKYVKAVQLKLPDPKTKSFDVIIKEAVRNPLTTAKINFDLSVARARGYINTVSV